MKRFLSIVLLAVPAMAPAMATDQASDIITLLEEALRFDPSHRGAKARLDAMASRK